MYQFEEKDWKLFRKLLPSATEMHRARFIRFDN